MEILLSIVGVSLLLLPVGLLGAGGYAGWLWHKGRANEFTGPVKGLIENPRIIRTILYVLTLSIECSLALVRAIVFGFISSVLVGAFALGISLLLAPAAIVYTDEKGLSVLFSFVAGAWGLGFLFGLVIAYFPIALSIGTWVGVIPGGNIITRWVLRARQPSRREFQIIKEALLTIDARYDSLKEPTDFFVIDQIYPAAYTIGSTLYLTKELVQSEHLVPVLAQAIGYIHNGDGLRLLALRRLVLPPFYFFTKEQQTEVFSKVAGMAGDAERVLDIRLNMNPAARSVLGVFFLAAIGGGIGTLLLSPLWAGYWSHADYEADDFAGQGGFAADLINYLETYAALEFQTPYQMNARPPAELRRDNLCYWIPETEGAEAL